MVDLSWEAFSIREMTNEIVDSADGWERRECGTYYWDEDHYGRIYVSQKMVDKYKLKECLDPLDGEWFASRIFMGSDEEDLKELQSKYTHEIYIRHCRGFSKDGDSMNQSQLTPHGDIGSEEFVAWYNDFPLELLSETNEDDVYIEGWIDSYPPIERKGLV